MRSSKKKLKKIFLTLPILIFLMLSAASADLIEPTRTLNADAKNHGVLSVYSEPPELAVVLDGTKIGVTPLDNLKVEVGSHVIAVNNVKTKIYITREKPLCISFFKGEFIEIPERPATSQTQVTPPIVTKKAPGQKSQKKKDEIEYQPSYWPLNPRGPIY